MPSPDEMTCLHCGSVYERTYMKVSMRDKDHADCDVCERRLESWDGSVIPMHRLIKRGDEPDS